MANQVKLIIANELSTGFDWQISTNSKFVSSGSVDGVQSTFPITVDPGTVTGGSGDIADAFILVVKPKQ